MGGWPSRQRLKSYIVLEGRRPIVHTASPFNPVRALALTYVLERLTTIVSTPGVM